MYLVLKQLQSASCNWARSTPSADIVRYCCYFPSVVLTYGDSQDYPPPGHTHEDIDATFSVIRQALVGRLTDEPNEGCRVEDPNKPLPRIIMRSN